MPILFLLVVVGAGILIAGAKSAHAAQIPAPPPPAVTPETARWQVLTRAEAAKLPGIDLTYSDPADSSKPVTPGDPRISMAIAAKLHRGGTAVLYLREISPPGGTGKVAPAALKVTEELRGETGVHYTGVVLDPKVLTGQLGPKDLSDLMKGPKMGTVFMFTPVDVVDVGPTFQV